MISDADHVTSHAGQEVDSTSRLAGQNSWNIKKSESRKTWGRDKIVVFLVKPVSDLFPSRMTRFRWGTFLAPWRWLPAARGLVLPYRETTSLLLAYPLLTSYSISSPHSQRALLFVLFARAWGVKTGQPTIPNTLTIAGVCSNNIHFISIFQKTVW